MRGTSRFVLTLALVASCACVQQKTESASRPAPAAPTASASVWTSINPVATLVPTVMPSALNTVPSATGVTSCPVTTFGVQVCQEYRNIDISNPTVIATARQSCDELKSTMIIGKACERANSLGGCMQKVSTTAANGPQLVVYFYRINASTTVDSVKTACTNGTYIAP